MDDPAGPPRQPRRRTSGIVAAAAIVLAGVALVGGGLAARGRPAPSVVPSFSTAPETARPTPGSVTTGYLVSPSDLADRVAKAGKGLEPWASAKANLLEDADAALPPAPHPAASLDIPDTEGPFVDDTAIAYGLALAYAATDDVRYAEGAREYIMAWVNTTNRLLNVCPEGGACQTSLIVGRVAPGFVFAADMIRPAHVMSAADETALQDWLRDLILPALSIRPSNWGDAGNFSRAVITDYLGDSEGFTKALDEWRERIDLIQADGHIPEEVRRGDDGMSYTQEALQYKLAVVRLAELRGIDLWDYVGKDGGSLRSAIDLLRTYYFEPDAWPWDPHVRVPSPSPMWEIAYQHWRDPSWPQVFAADRPFGEFGHAAIRWTTLTNGIPIE
jgi:hypothetical protein